MRNKSALVKKISKIKTPALYEGFSNVIGAQKQKEKGGETPYHFKELECAADQYAATIEATAASLSQILFGSLVDKVRVIIDDPSRNETKARVISKTVPEFKPAIELSKSTLQMIRNTKQCDLAKLCVKLFIFKDPDIHAGGNWGAIQKNDEINLINIDHDAAFCDFLKQFRTDSGKLGAETKTHLLMRWENLAYNTEYFFGVASPDDILALPFFVDTKPYNFPFKFQTRSQSESEIERLFDTLPTDPSFAKWKFFYFTKYLLLLTPERVGAIIESHSIAPEIMDKEFCDSILSWRQNIKNTLLLMPEFQYFFKNIFPSLLQKLDEEIEQYNQEFFDKKTGEIKQAKKQHIIDINTVRADLKNLETEIELAKTTDTAEKAAQREIQLDIARIQREMAAINTLHKAHDLELMRYERLTYLINIFSIRKNSQKNFSDLTEKECNTVKNIDIFKEKNRYAQNYPQKTVREFLEILANNSKNSYQSEYKKRIFKTNLFINQKIKGLFTKHGENLDTQQLTNIWNAYKNSDAEEKTNIFSFMTEYCEFKNIPSSSLQWFVDSMKEEKISARTTKNSVFEKLHGLVRICHQYVMPAPGLFQCDPLIKQAANKLLQLLKKPELQLSITASELPTLLNTLPTFFSRNIAVGNISAEEAVRYWIKLHYENGQFVLHSVPHHVKLNHNEITVSTEKLEEADFRGMHL